HSPVAAAPALATAVTVRSSLSNFLSLVLSRGICRDPLVFLAGVNSGDVTVNHQN
ncbi:hypothetical protein A2U01_0116329, partial [Trifolium medium]|nr:hypothetical protein [Trifolium medium]